MAAILCRCQITLELDLKVFIILACAPMTENITQMFKYICVEGEEKL